MLSFAVYLAVLLSSLKFVVTAGHANGKECGGDPGLLPNLNLGLPANSTVLVSGYLPEPVSSNNWICPVKPLHEYGVNYFSSLNGIWWSYYSGSTGVELGISASDYEQNPNQWALYMYQNNNATFNDSQGVLYFRICKYAGKYTPVGYPDKPVSKVCLIDKKVSFKFAEKENQVIGVTWSGNYVTFYGIDKSFRIYLPNKWNFVAVKCIVKETCAFFAAHKMITLNITTNGQGLIKNYSVCKECNGFPAHVFPVLPGGKIPGDFSFDNWFLLTNSSTIVNGKIVDIQPLKLLCLWPVPALVANDNKIYFNISGANCNGFKEENAYADVLRFSLNFTNSQVFNGIHSVTVNVVGGDLKFSCSNTSTYSAEDGVLPFGSLNSVYYCFVSGKLGNDSFEQFVGILPPIVKEIVISRYGSFYMNGVKLFEVPYVESVVFNVTSSVGSDFWTVAYAQNTEVLLEVNSTDIKDILYCDTPANKLKCQQLSFSLEDGFYPAAVVAGVDVPRTYVALPYHATHSFVNLTVHLGQGVDSAAYAQINGVNDSYCVNTTQFSTNFQQLDTTNNVLAVMQNGDCPFNFDSLNNFLSFDSICFNLQPVGSSCTISIMKSWMGFKAPWRSVYVSFKRGNRITGVKTASTGIFDPSVMELDNCTDYTIYGVSGRGIIRKANSSYISGLYYTSIAGQIIGFKNATTGEVFSVTPCQLTMQAAVVNDDIVGVISSTNASSIPFSHTITTKTFYYHTNVQQNCSEPVLTYANIGVCSDGSITEVTIRKTEPEPVAPITTGNVSIPSNFTVSVQVEYLQMYNKPVSVDCSTYVCNGNPRCLKLLTQYATACRTIEESLQLSARLESVEVANMISVSEEAIQLANVSYFDTYNISALLPRGQSRGSVIEDLLFNKVITSGLGTVDEDYKACTGEGFGAALADVFCAQYYNGIMVLPGVVDEAKMGLYTASLTGAMVMGGITAAAAIPFSLAVQSRLNYVALQTDVLQENQKILASAFNSAMSNITYAFIEVKNAIKDTSVAINTVAQALGKIQNVVNDQGQALSQLTRQLASNFQAISSSIQDIYNRLNGLEADAQVDRLITGRLAALNAFVTQTLTKYTEVRASRQLAQQKINECVKSQSSRYGFCGNGTHLFSISNAAPQGIIFFHTVLLPTEYETVEAWSGVCVNSQYGLVLRNVHDALYKRNDSYYITSRDMYEPRVPQESDFVRITGCSVVYLNITHTQIGEIIPEYIDVNKTLEEFLSSYPNYTVPDLNLDLYNQTVLNLTEDISKLYEKAESLHNKTIILQQLIDNLNNTYVDLEWLNRVETYIKWPWYVWLVIFLALAAFTFLMLYCCIATGCCGCLSCIFSSCADCRGRRLQRYEVEKIHIQ
uniref:Spike glycoprotein n=1 Tax=Bat Coronavirus RfHB20 TaxID=3018888 RepID=A0AA49EC50_9NIDO|nr:spike glycoprotein [Bat Coronavirus RfHB20]